MIQGYEYRDYCEEKRATDPVIGYVFTADGGFLTLTLAAGAMGQPIFGEGMGLRS